MKINSLFICALLCFSSCIFIKLDLTIKDRYQSAINSKTLNIELEGKNLCQLNYNDTLYGITANELKQCLTSIEKAIVYIWTPSCKNETCVPISTVQNHCDSLDYDLFVICTDYYPEIIKAQIKPQRPFFSINHLHYGSKIIGESHTAKFTKELIESETYNGRLLVFQNGKYNISYNLNTN